MRQRGLDFKNRLRLVWLVMVVLVLLVDLTPAVGGIQPPARARPDQPRRAVGLGPRLQYSFPSRRVVLDIDGPEINRSVGPVNNSVVK